jgi:hypothetical protein
MHNETPTKSAPSNLSAFIRYPLWCFPWTCDLELTHYCLKKESVGTPMTSLWKMPLKNIPLSGIFWLLCPFLHGQSQKFQCIVTCVELRSNTQNTAMASTSSSSHPLYFCQFFPQVPQDAFCGLKKKAFKENLVLMQLGLGCVPSLRS